MNFKRLLLFLAAPLALVMSSCEPDGPVYTNPSISITDADGAEVTAVNFGAEGGDATITITATRGWSISKQATWLGVTPSTYTNDTMEEKSVDVKITVGPNEGGPRTETIKVVMDKIEKNITVAQADNEGNTLGPKGAGTLEEPYNVARAMEIILAGTYTEDMVYTSGIISQLGEDGREQYGNYTFYISDDGTTAGQLLAYRCKYLNGKNFTISDNLEVGDEVIICGQLVNFKGNTPEIQSCYIVSHNGEMPDAPALKEGVYASDAAFVCNIDNSSKCVYSLGDTNVGGNDVSGFKLGTGSKAGVFTSQAIGVSGNKYLNFYAVAWNGKSSTLYWRVNGGEPMSQTLVANAGANNNAPYNGLVIAATDHYSVQLTGLQATDVIEFSTNAAFKAADDAASGRAIVFGIKLTDEPLEGESGSGNTGGGDQGGETPAPENALLWASFATDMANFTTENVELGGLDYVWNHDANHKQMKASAYKDDVRYVTESYLVSPVVALTGAEDYYMNFEHTGKFFGNMSEQATLWVREEGGAWAQLTIPTYMTGNDWTFVNSGDIALTAYAGKNIQIGFRYTSTATDAPTWEVTNVLVAKGTAGETPEQPEQPEQPEVELPEGAIVWNTNASSQTWAAETHETLGAGYSATVDNLKVGYYKHEYNNDMVEAKDDHIRVYKKSALVITPLDGKTITKVVMLCADPISYDGKEPTHYTFDLSVADGSTATANQETKVITWEGSIDKFEAYAVNGQVRIKTLAVVLDGEGGGNTEPEDPEDPETPVDPEEPTTVTLDEITGEGTYDITGATVVAVEYKQMIVKGTEKMLNVKNLKGAAANYNVGEVLNLTNAVVKDSYGVIVIDGADINLVIEKTEATVEVAHPTATTADAAWITSWLKGKTVEYVTATGNAVVSTGNEYALNVAVEGSETVLSVSFPTKEESAAFNNHNVTVSGYAFDYYSSNNYISVMLVSATDNGAIEEPEQPEDPETPVDPETLEALDANAYYVFKQATEFAPGKWYAMVAENNAATASTKNYDRMASTAAIALTDGISLPAACAFGFVSAEGGYTIQQYDMDYLQSTANYPTFNFLATAPESGHIWSVAFANGVATIVNTDTDKSLSYSPNYKNFEANATLNTAPALYELVEVDTNAHLLGTSVSSLSYTADGGEKTFDVTTYGEATLAATSAAEWLTVSVADGVVTVVAAANEGEAREAEVTVTFGEESVTVAVSQAAPLAEGEAAWVLVTDAATLAVGDQIVIVATDYDKALSTTQNNNNRKATSVTKSGNTVTFDSTVQVITLEAGTVDNTFGFNVGTGYLYAASGSSNHLKTGTLNDNASWLVTIDGSGVATIKAQGDKARNWMRYNSQSDLFSCYASGQADIAIYKYTE